MLRAVPSGEQRTHSLSLARALPDPSAHLLGGAWADTDHAFASVAMTHRDSIVSRPAACQFSAPMALTVQVGRHHQSLVPLEPWAARRGRRRSKIAQSAALVRNARRAAPRKSLVRRATLRIHRGVLSAHHAVLARTRTAKASRNASRALRVITANRVRPTQNLAWQAILGTLLVGNRARIAGTARWAPTARKALWHRLLAKEVLGAKRKTPSARRIA